MTLRKGQYEMKTVVDAVNEFHGVWPKYMGEDSLAIAMCIKDTGGRSVGCVTDVVNGYDDTYYKEICRAEEFNQCVAEMSEANWITEGEVKMKTVKDFKDAGLVFVVDDKIDFYDGCAGAISQICADDMNNKPYCYSGQVFYFAWRPLNTLPDNPKFECEIDIPNHRWRPMLEQAAKSSDDKPVFTQEMADRGESPPVGSLFRIHKHSYIMIGVSSLGSVVGEHCEFAEYKGFHARDCKPIDNRTPKQKAIDEMLQIIDDQCSHRKACEIIYNMLVDGKC